MLPADLIKKIKKVHIRTGRTVNTLMAGQYKSVFRGAGIEFEEVREYSPGDDVKSIDWKVSARLGKPFVKRYREERELIVMLLVDLSASGRFGTREGSKQELAAETGAILAFNAIRNNDKVGAILFTDRVERYIPPQKGQRPCLAGDQGDLRPPAPADRDRHLRGHGVSGAGVPQTFGGVSDFRLYLARR